MALDNLLSSLLRANGVSLPNWEILPFKKRRKLVSKESSKLFGLNNPIHKYLTSILCDSHDLHISRNLLVHGNVTLKMQTGAIVDNKVTGKISYVVQGAYKKQIILREFSDNDAGDVFYSIAHLSGRLNALTKNEHFLGLSPADKLVLQNFLDKNYQMLPKPTTP